MYIRKATLFTTLHPMVLGVYALATPVLAMLSRIPVFLAIAVVSSVGIHGFYYGIRQTGKTIKFLIPLIGLIIIANFILNPRGAMILFQIGHHTFTVESLCFGVESGAMLATVLLWLRCFAVLLPNEKFLYLFGIRLPNTALLLSMIFKLFPETQYKMQCIQNAQKGTVSNQKQSVKEKLKKALRQISTLLEWSMEDSIEMADSMKARAYGTERRTTYATYSFAVWDCEGLLFMLVCIVITGMGMYGTMSHSLASVCYIVFLWSPVLVELVDLIQMAFRDYKNKTKVQKGE
ncbi:MAG: energy-coupling factor transporter transmembrane component T [Lachnospiraceae bacterium]